MGIFSKMKKAFSGEDEERVDADEEEEYVELDTGATEIKGKVIVRPYVVEDFSDVKEVLDVIREGHTIALVNIKPIKDKDMIELKRVINKLKKTTDACDGDIAGFGDDYIVVTPSFATIHRNKQTETIKTDPGADEDK
ncbi:MAG: cell division protein SepF [Nanoarchaeota archaeon]